MNKKIIGMILTIMMILALFPTLPAKAADPYLRVGDTQIDTAVSASYMDGKVEYDASTHTLTLNDLDLTYNGTVIYADGLDFDLTIKGSAKLTSEYQNVISPHANLILDGDFEFYSAYQNTVLLNGWSLTIDGGSLYAKDEGGRALFAKELILNNGERFVVGDENANEIRIAQAFLVRFVNDDEDQTELQSGYVEKDITPSYTGNTPTKEADAQYTYTFAGWDPEITAVTGDATYTATYTKTVNKYDLTFDLNGGTLDGQTGIITMTYEYGSEINLLDAPTKEGCTFKYWKGSEYAAGAEYTVTEKHDFTAEWEEVKKEQDASPKTGDHNDAGLWAAVLGGSLLAVILLITAGRKYLKKHR